MAAKKILKNSLIGCGGLFLLFILMGIFGAFNTAPSPDTLANEIPYTLVPNTHVGSPQEQILIDPQYANEEDMLALGKELAKERNSEDYVFISIYTDQQAIDLRDKILAMTETAEEDAIYDQYYVGQYNKNESQNFETYVVYPGGFVSGEEKTYGSSELH